MCDVLARVQFTTLRILYLLKRLCCAWCHIFICLCHRTDGTSISLTPLSLVAVFYCCVQCNTVLFHWWTKWRVFAVRVLLSLLTYCCNLQCSVLWYIYILQAVETTDEVLMMFVVCWWLTERHDILQSFHPSCLPAFVPPAGYSVCLCPPVQRRWCNDSAWPPV